MRIDEIIKTTDIAGEYGSADGLDSKARARGLSAGLGIEDAGRRTDGGKHER